MFKLDDNFLQEIGLGGLPAQDKNAMLQHIYETLELRVGMRLAEQMTDAQLTEFEGFIDRNDEAGALKWLETNLPHYKQVVAEELEKLKNEIKQQAPKIVEAAQAAAAQNPQPAAAPAPAPNQTAPAAPSPNPTPAQPAAPETPTVSSHIPPPLEDTSSPSPSTPTQSSPTPTPPQPATSPQPTASPTPTQPDQSPTPNPSQPTAPQSPASNIPAPKQDDATVSIPKPPTEEPPKAA